ncbi:MAG: hypothetical protein KF770_14200 [Anaerolineae bacterium]|nr:hypothetical protein [Anaerolineae bacterium]
MKLVDHAYRQLLVEELLDWAKENNPRRFDQCRPYLRSEQIEPIRNTSSKLFEAGLCLPDNNIGRGISLGGNYRGLPLKIIATEWYEYGQGNWSRSGWLYVPQWTDNHATTFFKLHLPNHNSGYIHLLDAADPIHTIWLSTTAGIRIEKQFHYLAHPADVWDFKWKAD